MAKDWLIAPVWEQRDALARALNLSPVVAQVLFNRGAADADTARLFLDPRMMGLHEPDAMPNATEAARRIVAAVRSRRKIILYGDYDVDGITGVAILWHCLKRAGADVGFYIPHRLEEGYGVKPESVESLARDGASMIITIDCGVTAIEPAAKARALGVEFIITDHHNPHTAPDGRVEMPEALVVHPGLPDPDGKVYPNPHLSGAGVAHKLAWAIAQQLSGADRVSSEFKSFLVEATGLAALGIIADVVPLTGENRIIAFNGLRGLPQSTLPGVRALIEAANLTGRSLSGYDIGFKLAPRLNAIGRMGHARLAVEMLTRADAGEAMRIAQNLEQHNRARQQLQRRITDEAMEMVSREGQDSDGVRGIVLASPEWHAGIIGVVAGRIAEAFCRPTVMIAVENGVGQGSARSIRNFALHEVFADCREHLQTYGGHAMAAGLRIESCRIDAFRDAFHQRAAQLLTPADLRHRLHIDDEVTLTHLTHGLVSDLARLEPFGAGNAPPRLSTDWLQLAAEPRVVGASGSHLQVVLSDGTRQCKGIAFGMAKYADALRDHRRCKVAFEPMANEWNGRTSVEMRIIDFRFPDE